MSKKNGNTPAPSAAKPKRTIFILYIPGGAMLGIIPVTVLARLKQLTDTPAIELFQVFDGVSTGSIPIAGLNIRNPDNPCVAKFTEEESLQMFCERSPAFFPDIANRYLKMVISGAGRYARDKLDPLHQDALQISDIGALCRTMSAKADPEIRPDIDRLLDISTRRWLSKGDKAAALQLCDRLRQDRPELADETRKISELVYVRHATKKLEAVFRKSVIGSLGLVAKYWANNYLFDPSIPKRVFRDVFGEARMSDCLRSTYITTYDKRRRAAHTSYCRKEDLFSLSPGNPSATSAGNIKLWDAVMASIANPFGYPLHRTEDGMICSDYATIHTPLYCVTDILAHKPADTTVKLVILGTGKHVSPDQNQHEQLEYNANFSVIDSFMQGEGIEGLEDLQSYTMSQLRQSLVERLGAENIIEITPRLSPHSYAESLELPSRNPFDASQGNIMRLLKTAQRLHIEEDERIRQLAFMLVENLYNLGQMEEAKFRMVSERLGVAVPLADTLPVADKAPSRFNLPTPADMLRNAWARVSGLWGGKYQAVNKSSPSIPYPTSRL